MTTKYRVHWKKLATDTTGHGPAVFDHDTAQQIANRLDARHKGHSIHWVEPVEVEEEQCNPD